MNYITTLQMLGKYAGQWNWGGWDSGNVSHDLCCHHTHKKSYTFWK